MNFRFLKYTFGIILFLGTYSLSAQVAINDDGTDGDASVELDIKSTDKGVVFPVMTEAQRDAIPLPAAGLLIFNTTDIAHNYYDGTNWIQIDNSGSADATTNPTVGVAVDGVGVGIANPDMSAILHIVDVTKGFLLPRIDDTTEPSPTAIEGLIYYNVYANVIAYYDGAAWSGVATTTEAVGGIGPATAADGLLIGTGTIEASAKMEVISSTGKGLLIPRMTSADRITIDTPIDGLTIYNTDTDQFEVKYGNDWLSWDLAPLPLGTISSNPGLSCKDVYDNNAASVGVDGSYWIDPDAGGANTPYLATCDMTTEGGGWTLVENTGPKGSATNTIGQLGATPILTAAGGSHQKMSDSDINLIRGAYATSIMRLQRPNGNAAAFPHYFVDAIVWNSDAPNGQQIRKFYTSYADAISTTSLQTSASTFTSGFSTWAISNQYGIIWDYTTEGLITANGLGFNDCGGTDVSSRGECNALLWVKQP
jgi:hypothetical protein